ncbi:MAG: STAS/SEC14 domain-containing protein [Reyranella sp.]|nr:STAS/SEC14 domain-containing protein [Reyranella sp.]
MPLHWTIDPQQRLATATADGDVTRADIETFHEELRQAGGFGYRKLFDAVRGTFVMDAEDLMALGVRLRASHDEGPIGPLAVVVSDDQFEKAAHVLGMLAAADRKMRVFRELAQARKWLEGLPR